MVVISIKIQIYVLVLFVLVMDFAYLLTQINKKLVMNLNKSTVKMECKEVISNVFSVLFHPDQFAKCLIKECNCNSAIQPVVGVLDNL